MNLSKTLAIWWMASRPKTLAAALAPVFIGTGLAWRHGSFDMTITMVTIVCAALIQIGTNFANDYYDFINGADTDERIGFERATAKGLVSANQMKTATFIAMGLAFLTGLYLVYVGGLVILLIGVLSIIFGIAYTGGPYPLGYNGLGDVFVFIFFGIVAVTGTYYLNTLTWSSTAFLVSIPVGALSVNILVVNNLRDVHQDRIAGKRTLGVLLGESALKFEYLFMVALAFATPIYLYFVEGFGLAVLSSFVVFPIAIVLSYRIVTNVHKPKLNAMLEATAQFLAVYSIIFTFSLVYS